MYINAEYVEIWKRKDRKLTLRLPVAGTPSISSRRMNPGLQSRFNRYIEFPDYTADELAQIFLLTAERSQYSCDGDVRASLRDVMQKAVETKDKNFGNGRFVRNLFESAIQRQAVRLSTVKNIMMTEKRKEGKS